jgi:hypothetical protein
MFPSELTAPPRHFQNDFFLSPVTVVVFLTTGFIIGKYLDGKLQDFEQQCQFGTQKIRLIIHQIIRITLFGAGTAGLVVSIVKIISANDNLVIIAMASFALGIAVITGSRIIIEYCFCV